LAFSIEENLMNLRETFNELENIICIEGEFTFEIGLVKLRYFNYINELDNDSFTQLYSPFYHSIYFSKMKFDKVFYEIMQRSNLRITILH